MIKKTYITFVVFSILFGQSEKYGGGPNAFYQLQTSAREFALGGAGIVTATGPFAALWNPSGIADTSSVEQWTAGFNLPFSLTRNNSKLSTNTINGFSMFSGGVLYRHRYQDDKNLFFGLNLVHRGHKDVIHTELNITNEIQAVGSPSNYSQTLIMLSLAGYFNNVKAGIAVKPILSNMPGIDLFHGYGIDAGYRLILFKDWRMIDAMEQGFVIKMDKDKRNTQIRYGWGFNIDFNDIGLVDINLASDFFSGENTNTEWATGLELSYADSEFSYADQVFIRAGINTNIVAQSSEPRYGSFGLGFKSSLLIVSISYGWYWKNNYGEYLQLVDDPIKLDVIFKF